MDSNLDPAVIQQVLALQNNEDDPQAIQLARKQHMVNALRAQSLAPPQGQMISGHYVGPGVLAPLAQVAGSALSAREQGRIDTGMGELSQRRIAGRSAYLNALTQAMRRGTNNGMPTTPPTEDIAAGY